MRKESFTENEHYHIYNRGVEKRDIFLDDADRWRFLTLLILMQGQSFIPNISRMVPHVRALKFDKDIFEEILKTRIVEINCFCLMPNHFHLIIHQTKAVGISNFMMRLLDAYTKYFNTKYQRTGHLFESSFKARHIDQNEYINYLSAYIHLNPRALQAWKGKEILYQWSSFQDFANKNRWGVFLKPLIVLSQFKNTKEYKSFVEKSHIKLKEGELPPDLLFD